LLYDRAAMTGLKRRRSLRGATLLVGFTVALAGFGITPPRVGADDRPASAPSILEMMKTPAPSAEEGMNDAVRDGLATSPAASKDCARHPNGSAKKRLSISTALKSACADRKHGHEAAPTTEDGSSSEKR